MEENKVPEPEEEKPEEQLEDLAPEKDPVGGLRTRAVANPGISAAAQKKEDV